MAYCKTSGRGTPSMGQLNVNRAGSEVKWCFHTTCGLDPSLAGRQYNVSKEAVQADADAWEPSETISLSSSCRHPRVSEEAARQTTDPHME